jgi:hypothetical protein
MAKDSAGRALVRERAGAAQGSGCTREHRKTPRGPSARVSQALSTHSAAAGRHVAARRPGEVGRGSRTAGVPHRKTRGGQPRRSRGEAHVSSAMIAPAPLKERGQRLCKDGRQAGAPSLSSFSLKHRALQRRPYHSGPCRPAPEKGWARPGRGRGHPSPEKGCARLQRRVRRLRPRQDPMDVSRKASSSPTIMLGRTLWKAGGLS